MQNLSVSDIGRNIIQRYNHCSDILQRDNIVFANKQGLSMVGGVKPKVPRPGLRVPGSISPHYCVIAVSVA